MLDKFLYYPTLCAGMLMTKLSRRRWYDRIDDTVVLGALPFPSVTDKLIQEEGVRGMITMNQDFELKGLTYSGQQLAERGVEWLHLPTTDLTGTPSQSALVAGVGFLLSARAAGHSIYVHCKAGRTRSATLTAAYLMTRHSHSPEEAVNFIKERRPHIWLRQKQLDSLHQYYQEQVVEKDR